MRRRRHRYLGRGSDRLHCTEVTFGKALYFIFLKLVFFCNLYICNMYKIIAIYIDKPQQQHDKYKAIHA